MDLSWLPNWRNESEYPAPDELPLRLWAWEFVRRNPIFQKDMDRIPMKYFLVKRSSFAKWLGFDQKQFLAFLFSVNFFELYDLLAKFDCYAEEIVNNKLFHEIENDVGCMQLTEDHGLQLEHYKFNFPLSYFQSESFVEPLDFHMKKRYTGSEIYNELIEDDEVTLLYKDAPRMSFTARRKVKVLFDLDRSLDKQLELVWQHVGGFVSYMQSWEEKKGIKLRSRIDRDDFPLYLRVLDGRVSGATNNEIAEQFVEESLLHKTSTDEDYLMKKIGKHYKAATEIRDCGYFSIAAMETHKSL